MTLITTLSKGATKKRIFRITVPVARVDHDMRNNDENKLAALCRLCHEAYDDSERAQNRKHNALRDAGRLPLLPTGDNTWSIRRYIGKGLE